MHPQFLTLILVFALVGCTSGSVEWGTASSGPNIVPSNISEGSAKKAPDGLTLVSLPSPGDFDPNFHALEQNFNDLLIPIQKELPGLSIFGFDTKDDIKGAATSAAMDANGNLVVLGFSSPDNDIRSFTLVRLNLEGKLDSSFGNLGFARFAVPLGCSLCSPLKTIIQRDGKIIVVLTESPGNYPYLMRLTSDGKAIDDTFGVEGVATLSVSNASQFFSKNVVLNPADDSVTLLGSFGTGSGANPAYLPVSSNGVVSPVIQVSPAVKDSRYYDAFYDSILLPNGIQQFLGGWSEQWVVQGAGTLVFSRGVLQRGVLLPDGSTVAAGVESGNPARAIVLKRLPSGLPDPTFGVAGEVTLEASLEVGGYEIASRLLITEDIKAVQIDSHGNVFLLIKERFSTSTVLVAKLRPNGEIDSGFAKSGSRPGYLSLPMPAGVINQFPVSIHFRKTGFVDVVFSFLGGTTDMNAWTNAVARIAAGD